MCTLGALLLVTMSMAALSIGPGAGEGWIAVRDRVPTSKIPLLIEWDGTVAIMHREGRKICIQWSECSGLRLPDGRWLALPATPASDAVSLQELLDDLASRRTTHYALFAVQPSGFASFNRLVAEFGPNPTLVSPRVIRCKK
jgi:hypothetical protein